MRDSGIPDRKFSDVDCGFTKLTHTAKVSAT